MVTATRPLGLGVTLMLLNLMGLGEHLNATTLANKSCISLGVATLMKRQA